ncbi:MAG: YIP1 family protein [Acidobacteria bacterium]|nr:YIP1 family protein [Acidobacteriota bacterium]
MNNAPIGEQPQDYQGFAGKPPTEQVKKLGVLERITGMFFEPGNTFRSLKAHPNWLVAFLITGLVVAVSLFVFTNRVPYEIRRQAILDNMMKTASRFAGDEFQLQKMREEFERRVPPEETLRQKLTAPLTTIAGMLLIAVIAAGLYLVGTIIMGKRITFKQALAVRVYSDLPPVITSSILLIILMYLKSPDQIDPVNPHGMLTSNLGPLVDAKEHIVLGTIANNIDLFQIWSLILAVIGLSIMPEKMRHGQAIGIVVVVWLLGLLLKIGYNTMTGSATM